MWRVNYDNDGDTVVENTLDSDQTVTFSESIPHERRVDMAEIICQSLNNYNPMGFDREDD